MPSGLLTSGESTGYRSRFLRVLGLAQQSAVACTWQPGISLPGACSPLHMPGVCMASTACVPPRWVTAGSSATGGTAVAARERQSLATPSGVGGGAQPQNILPPSAPQLCSRSYPPESTRSLQHSEVKQARARSVLGWGTTREARVLATHSFCLTFGPRWSRRAPPGGHAAYGCPAGCTSELRC